MRSLIQRVADRGHLTPGPTVDQATDICHAVNSDET
jgi:hypothetical protein